MGERGDAVLLVDDDRKLLLLLHRVLESAGYRVLSAGSGKEALSLYQRNSAAVSLIVTDVQMPELPGPELVDELSKQGCTVPVLYISGFYDETAFYASGQARGRNIQFLRKPFVPSALVVKVSDMIGTPPLRKPPGEAGPQSKVRTA